MALIRVAIRRDLIFLLPEVAGAVEYTFAPLHLPYECPGYETKRFNGEVLEIRSTLSLPSLPGPLRLGVVAPDRALSMG